MNFFKVSIILLFCMVSYIAHVLAKLEPDHIDKIALVFVSIGSLISAFAGVFAKIDSVTESSELDTNIDD